MTAVMFARVATIALNTTFFNELNTARIGGKLSQSFPRRRTRQIVKHNNTGPPPSRNRRLEVEQKSEVRGTSFLGEINTNNNS